MGKEKTYSEKHPIVGSSLLVCERMESNATSGTVNIEPSSPEDIYVLITPSLLSKTDRFQSSLTNKVLKGSRSVGKSPQRRLYANGLPSQARKGHDS